MSCLLVVFKVKAHLEICYWISAAKSKLLPKATQLQGITGLNLSSYSCIDHIFYVFVMLLEFLPSSFNLLANVSEFLSCMRLSLTLASSSAGVSISKFTLQTPPQTPISMRSALKVTKDLQGLTSDKVWQLIDIYFVPRTLSFSMIMPAVTSCSSAVAVLQELERWWICHPVEGLHSDRAQFGNK